MSKKTHRIAELKEQEKAHRPAHVSVAAKKPAGKNKRANGGWVTGPAQTRTARTVRANPAMSATYLRVVGVLMAVLGIGGGLYWMAQVGTEFTPGVIVGLIALGLLGGLGLFTTMRAKELASSARSSKKP